MARKLVVEIIGDASSLEKSYAKAGKATGKFGQEIERAGRGATVATIGFRGLGRSVAFASGAFLGGAGLTVAMKTSVEAASNLSEQMSKSNQVFGDSADAVTGWSKNTVNAMGLAQDQALQTASSFGALLRPIGLTGDAAAKQSERLTQLGADLASFYNTSVTDALDAIRSGLVGESEPLRRYGVLLSETRVQQEALTETGKKNARQLTDQDKVLARINLTFKDSAQAQGDFSRTSEGFANQTRILQANLRQLEIEIGQKLLPALTGLVRWINQTGIPALGKLADAFSGIRNAADKLKAQSDLFHITGLQLGKALAKGIRDGLTGGIPVGGGGGGEPGDLTSAFRLLIEAAVGQEQQAIANAVARLNRPTASSAASTIGTDRAQGQKGGPLLYPGTPVEQRNLIFDNRISRMLDRVQDIPTLRGQIARLREISALIQKRHDVTKDITRRLTLEDQLAQINRDILGDQAAIASKDAAAAKKAKDAAEKAAKAEKALAKANVKRATDRVAAINAAAVAQVKSIAAFSNRVKSQQLARAQREQFLALGLTGGGDQPLTAVSPGKLRALLRAIRGTDQDTAANRTFLLGGIADLLGRNGKVTKATVQKISEFYDTINGALKQGAKDTLPYFKRYSAAAIVASLGAGLTGSQRRQLELKLSALGPGMTVPGGRSAAYAATGARPNNIVIHTVHVNGVQDMAGFEDAIVRRQRARAYARRGAR